MKLSIIVTAFNEEKYIHRCLDSLVKQKTNFDYEVIIVNDGSTDHTQDVIDQYVADFGNIFSSFCKKNSGQGLSRNFGIQQSSGDYIGYADADNWVEPEFVEQMCLSAQKNDADVVVCDVYKIFTEQKFEENVISLNDKSEMVDITNYIRNGQSNSYSWNKIYKRSIWQQFKFKKMAYEDLDIIIPILSNCRRIAYVAAPLYNYYKHSGTTTSAYRNPRLFDIFTAYKDLLRDVNQQFIKDAEFCVAKRILRNIDTPGFGYHLGYFIQLIHGLVPYFKHNKFINEDRYVSEIKYFLKTDLIENKIFVSGELALDAATFYKFDENIVDCTNQVCTYSNLKVGGILLRKDVELASPIGYLRALGNFVLFGKNHQILAVGMQRESLLLQRIFLEQQAFHLEEILDEIGSLVKEDGNIIFDIKKYSILDLNNKLKIKKGYDKSLNI